MSLERMAAGSGRTQSSPRRTPKNPTDFTAYDWGGPGKGCCCLPVVDGRPQEMFWVGCLLDLVGDGRVVRPVVGESSSGSYDLRERNAFYRAMGGDVLTVSPRATSSAMQRLKHAPKRGRTAQDETREKRDELETRIIAGRVLDGAVLKAPSARPDPAYLRKFERCRLTLVRQRRGGYPIAPVLRAAFPEASALLPSNSEFVTVAVCAIRADSREECGRLLGQHEHGYPSLQRSNFAYKPFAEGNRRRGQAHDEIRLERAARQRLWREAYHLIAGKDTVQSEKDTEESDRREGP